MGARVEAGFEEGDLYYPGLITAVNDDWSYAISYDDGDEEDGVKPEFVVPSVRTHKPNGGGGAGSTTPQRATDHRQQAPVSDSVWHQTMAQQQFALLRMSAMQQQQVRRFVVFTRLQRTTCGWDRFDLVCDNAPNKLLPATVNHHLFGVTVW